ncbi:hypothetical protein EDB85DRAFT_2205075 [Lactarius pseudohatsudake]|nr:hypothetical protein EDB85DRAFT_2205075 [Lactarius pseudohatsudake]
MGKLWVIEGRERREYDEARNDNEMVERKRDGARRDEENKDELLPPPCVHGLLPLVPAPTRRPDVACKTLPPQPHRHAARRSPQLPTHPHGTQDLAATSTRHARPRHPDMTRKAPPPPSHCHAATWHAELDRQPTTPPRHGAQDPATANSLPRHATTADPHHMLHVPLSIYTDIWKFQDLLFPDADWDAEKGTLRGESAPEEDESSSDPGMACGSKRGTEDEVCSELLSSLMRALRRACYSEAPDPDPESLSIHFSVKLVLVVEHNQPFKILAQRPYIFQCVVGGNSSSSGQTMDVKTYTEFQEMVELLQDEERAKKAKLTVELEKIKKAAQRVRLLLRPFCFV